jgi:predicted nuclease of predicted toxin-antitoxin system
MRLLLDENLDWRLRRDLAAHHVDSVPLIGWTGVENGELFKKAVEAGFNVLITMDSNMVDTRPLMPALLALLPHIKSGTMTFLPS